MSDNDKNDPLFPAPEPERFEPPATDELRLNAPLEPAPGVEPVARWKARVKLVCDENRQAAAISASELSPLASSVLARSSRIRPR